VFDQIFHYIGFAACHKWSSMSASGYPQLSALLINHVKPMHVSCWRKMWLAELNTLQAEDVTWKEQPDQSAPKRASQFDLKIDKERRHQ